MYYLVFYKINSEDETFVILATFIWFFPSVNSHMFYQTSFLGKKTFVTLVTLIWLLTCMNSLVYYKMKSQSEPFVSGCIDMVFLKSVFSGVPFRAKHLSH